MSVEKEKYPAISQLGGVVRRIRRLPDPEDKRWSALNPSIAASPTDYAVAIRSSNYLIDPTTGVLNVLTAGLVKNRMWFCYLTDDLELDTEMLREITFDSGPYDLDMKRGCEDPKLFWRDGSWFFTAVILEVSVPIARIGLFKLENYHATLLEIYDYDWMDAKRVEKNWMATYEKSEYFDYIYGPNLVVLNGVLKAVAPIPDSLRGLRGGGNLWKMPDGSYLAICHRMYAKPIRFWDPRSFAVRDSALRNYTHLFVKYNERGVVTHVSDEFQFLDRGIEYAAGILVKDSMVHVSFGSKDASSHIADIPLAKVLDMLKEVGL